jgi:hypothetical protein
MWCKYIGMALLAGASAMCSPLQVPAQGKIVPPLALPILTSNPVIVHS